MSRKLWDTWSQIEKMERECLYQVLNVNPHNTDATEIEHLIKDLKLIKDNPVMSSTRYSQSTYRIVRPASSSMNVIKMNDD